MTAEPNFEEIPSYIAKKGEEFMSNGQLKHFIHKLNVWREQLVFEAENTINHIQEDSAPVATCGIEIGLERLEARPTADQCIDCKTISEKKEI
jgi:DnaK suppressor protein